MSPSILQHPAFKVFFCLCCIGLFSVPSYTFVTRHRDDYPNDLKDPARLRLVFKPLRLESFGAPSDSCVIPNGTDPKIGIKIWLNKVDWSPPLLVFTQARIYQPNESYNFNESDVYVNPKKAHQPFNPNMDVRLFLAMGNVTKPYLTWHQYGAYPYQAYGQDVTSGSQGQLWTKKNQLFNITFANCGYRFTFRMDSICDQDYYTVNCKVHCRRNLSHVTDCNHNDGMVCETGFHDVPTKKFYYVHGARRYILNWSMECNKQEARIALIESEDEQTIATRVVLQSNLDLLIGVKRKAYDYWRFVDYVTNKYLTYTNWYPGEPNNSPSGTKCVEIGTGYYNGKWNDDYCSVNNGAMCHHRRNKCVDTNECKINPQICQNGSTCINTVGSYRCDINECNINPQMCQNEATCTNTVGSYRCVCPTYATGKHCENVNECTKFPGICKNNGTCMDTVGSYRCVCPTYATGQHCEHLNECTKFPGICKNNGSCTDTRRSYRCDCQIYATGEHCEDLNECTKDPGICKNNGSCTDTHESYRCDCQIYATGKRCEHLNECTKYPGICKNDGTCMDTVGSYRCDCPTYATGKHCEHLNECTKDPGICKNDGNCTDTELSYSCDCPTYATGKHCEHLNECKKSPGICKNNATCTDTVESYRCDCHGPFNGRHCELDDCGEMNCQNGGTCVKTKWDEIVCLCPDEFAGSHCEDLNECVKYPHICENAGVCTNLIGTFRCYCPGDNCGRRCEL